MKVIARGLWKNKEVRRHFETPFIMGLTVLVLSTEESTVSQIEKKKAEHLMLMEKAFDLNHRIHSESNAVTHSLAGRAWLCCACV